MKRSRLKNFLLIMILIAVTGAAMAYSSKQIGGLLPKSNSNSPQRWTGNNRLLGVTGHLIQDKVLQGSDGTVGLTLTLKAEEVASIADDKARNVDLVIVLDRSGSMNGRKINDARQAILKLLYSLTTKDRFALVTYSEGVHIATNLVNVTADNRELFVSRIKSIRAGGATNIEAGLRTGISTLITSRHHTNSAKVILVSDGIANRGITNVSTLAAIAEAAVEKEFAVSTVGVGADFNEHLMTAIADRGTGNYYYLKDPAAFADVIQKEFYKTQTAFITNLRIQIPVKSGIILADAEGYPITKQNGNYVFYPGSLRSGQNRKLFLTLQVPTNSKKVYQLDNVTIGYHHDNRVYKTSLNGSYNIACINNSKKVFSSINKKSWAEKIINEDFNRLKQEVAADLKAGKKQSALDKIDKYHGEQEAVNAAIGSASVAENLDKDLKELKSFVIDTFHGAPAAVKHKQNANAKALQYEGYRGRRR
jgi:Ca-activated chloride channel family protein